MDNLRLFAENEKQMILTLKKKVEKLMDDNLPEGTLVIKRKQDYTEYYRRLPDSPGNRSRTIYLSNKEIRLARALAQKDYNNKAMHILEASEAAIDSFIKKYPEKTLADIYSDMVPERQKLITPVILSDVQYIEQWLNTPYAKKEFGPDDKQYLTERGEQVRSKSEVLIANALYHAGIPYKYECPLSIRGVTLYPDFTILDVRVRREIYLEHFGMMDDPKYVANFQKKLSLYEYNGIFPGRNLICTFESSAIPLDTRLLNIIIYKYLKDPVQPGNLYCC